MEVRIPIFSKRIATDLIRNGFEVGHTAPNHSNKFLTVYFFKYCQELLDYMEEYHNVKLEYRGNDNDNGKNSRR